MVSLKIIFRIVSVVGLGLSCHGAGLAQTSLASEALEQISTTNITTLEDLDAGVEVQGTTFVGNDLVGNSATFGSRLQGGDVLTVVGNIEGGPKNINNGGNVRVGGLVSTNLNLNGGGSLINDATITQNELREAALALSGSLLELPANSSASIPSGQPGPVRFVAEPNEAGLAVFSFPDGNALFSNSRVQQIELLDNGAAAIVINVGGRDVKFDRGNIGGALSQDSISSRIIWNFYEAETLTLRRRFEGSILAPMAYLDNQSGVDGGIIVNSARLRGSPSLPLFSGGEALIAVLGNDAIEPNVFVSFNFTRGDDDDPSLFNVAIDGEEVAANITVADIVELELPEGSFELSVRSDFAFAGFDTIVVDSVDEPVSLTVSLSEENFEALNAGDLEIIGIGEGAVVDVTSPTLELEFVDFEFGRISVDVLGSVLASRIETGSFFGGRRGIPVDDSDVLQLTDLFEVTSEGTISALDPSNVYDELESLGPGEYTLTVRAADTQNSVTQESNVLVRLGQFDISGQIELPSIDPAAVTSPSSALVEILSSDGSVSQNTFAASDGTFAFDALPPAVYQIQVQIDGGDSVSAATGTVRLFDDAIVTLRPLTPLERDIDLIEEVSVILGPCLDGPCANPCEGGACLPDSILAERLALLESLGVLSPDDCVGGPCAPPCEDGPCEGGVPDFSEEFSDTAVTVEAGDEGEAVSVSIPLTVSPFSSTTSFQYQVMSLEFPEFVEDQSEFDDEWSVRLLDDRGAILFVQTLNVNAQLSGAPTSALGWNGDNRTDVIVETVEFEPLDDPDADTPDRIFILELSVTNISDSALATSIRAESVSPLFRITALENLNGASAGVNYLSNARAFPNNQKAREANIVGTNGFPGVVSVPVLGDGPRECNGSPVTTRNCFNVRLPFVLEPLEAMGVTTDINLEDITAVTARLLFPDTEDSVEIFSNAGVSADVLASPVFEIDPSNVDGESNASEVAPDVDETEENDFQVLVSFNAPNGPSFVLDSTIQSETLSYELDIEVTVEGISEQRTVSFPSQIALYAGSFEDETANNMRSGSNDNGGDDWASVDTVEWIRDNRALLPAFVGDISAEHGSYNDHSASHRVGNNIDTRFYGTVLNGSGDSILRQMYALAIDAASTGNPQAIETIRLFIEDQRAGIEGLDANSDVTQIIGMNGAACPPPPGDDRERRCNAVGPNVLPSGWFGSLITRGVVEVPGSPDTVLINIGGGLSEDVNAFEVDTGHTHDNHYHIAIRN